MTTMREHLQAIIDLDVKGPGGYQTRFHAHQALKILGESELRVLPLMNDGAVERSAHVRFIEDPPADA